MANGVEGRIRELRESLTGNWDVDRGLVLLRMSDEMRARERSEAQLEDLERRLAEKQTAGELKGVATLYPVLLTALTNAILYALSGATVASVP